MNVVGCRGSLHQRLTSFLLADATAAVPDQSSSVGRTSPAANNGGTALDSLLKSVGSTTSSSCAWRSLTLFQNAAADLARFSHCPLLFRDNQVAPPEGTRSP
jgi:hypothetical protein